MRPQPIQDSNHRDAALREMLLHDVYDLPLEETPQETGITRMESGPILETVPPRQPWCLYSDGTVCSDSPN